MTFNRMAIQGTLFFALALSVGWCQDTEEIVLEGNNGSFLSPNYPSYYGENKHVLYRALLSTPGPQQVRLDLIMDLKRKKPVWHNGLSVYQCLHYVYIPELSLEACGEVNTSRYLSLHGNEFNMSFVSDNMSAWNKKGFNITYTVLEGTCKATVRSWGILPITDMMARDSLVFSLRTCDGLLLSLYPHDRPSSDVMVYIGKESWIRSCRSCQKTHFSGTSAYADCCQFHAFWLNWTQSTIALGHGTTVGSNLVVYDESFEMDVRFVYLYTIGDAVVTLDAPLPDSYCKPSPTIPPPAVSCTPTTLATPRVETSPTPIQTNSFDDILATADTSRYDVVPSTDGAVTISDISSAVSTISPDVDYVRTASVQDDSGAASSRDESTVLSGTFDNVITATGHHVSFTPWSLDVVSTSSVVTSATWDTDVITASTGGEAVVTTSDSRGKASTSHTTNDSAESSVTAPPKKVKYSRQQRPCKCLKLVAPRSANKENQERQELERKKKEVAETIKKGLAITKANVSSSLRRKVSAEDKRQSSVYVGLVIGSVCCAPLALIVLGDCIVLIAAARAKIRTKLRTWHRGAAVNAAQ